MVEPGQVPFFDAIMNAELIERNVFAFYMSMNPDLEDSEVTFGSYDRDRFYGEISWHPVINKLFWSLKLNDIRIGNKSLGLCLKKNCMVAPDSGTSYLTMPKWAFN